jgi:hypothetical protein
VPTRRRTLTLATIVNPRFAKLIWGFSSALSSESAEFEFK